MKIMIIQIGALIVMIISFLIIFKKSSDSDISVAVLLQIIVWLMMIYAKLSDIESHL